MEKRYDPTDIEAHCYQQWESNGYFAPQGGPDSYCIMIPPPNVTGVLHMGHGFQSSLQDALIRYQRMHGKKTLWQVGTDHAGIATQMVVERQLAADNKTRHDLGRAAFIERVWQWKEHSGGTITQQMRRLGVSVDWQRERFTMDEGLTHAVRQAFIQLYEQGLIYRGKRLVNWDPKLGTAISDLEVNHLEENGHLWHIRYPLTDSEASITIATTRPETLLGDVAIAVHPHDARYQALVGKTIRLPLCDREIPIIADDYVDQDFGSGCVKITPAHDFNDHAIGKRHNLPQINILNADATLNDSVPSAYQGLNCTEARKKVVADLEQQGLIVKVDEHKLSVPRSERSGVVCEPFLTDQWFVAMQSLAEPALEVVKKGEIRFMPEGWQINYYAWLENIEDWCISRQLWWGHRIPAWYDEQGNIYVGNDEADVRAQHQLADTIVLRQDEDVLDTWFSSALWPFSTLGWPEQTPDFATFYPTNVLVTGFDIIFFWVARMIMFGLHFTGQVPFREVYITPLLRDAQGQKMSKSKGNVIDPIDLIDGIDLEGLIAKNTKNLMQPHLAQRIEKDLRKQFPDGIPAFGTDALRFTLCALASPGRNVNFDLERLTGYRNFCNKLWNAARYVLMNCEEHDCGADSQELEFSAADRWIQSQLQQTLQLAKQHFAQYRFDLLCKTLYEFTWNTFCDWYLELAKPILSADDASAAQLRGTRYTLVHTLESLLRALHPLMPFITETIWQRVKDLAGIDAATIMLQAYPQAETQRMDEVGDAEIAWLQQAIIALRTLRAEMNIAPGKALPVLLRQGNAHDKHCLSKLNDLFIAIAKVESLTWLSDNDNAPQAATALVGDLELLVPMANLIDKQAELARLDKEITKLQKKLHGTQAKLANPNFSDKAPADVVAKERDACAQLENALAKLQSQRTSVSSIA